MGDKKDVTTRKPAANASAKSGWFEVDKRGLGEQSARDPFGLLCELYQNAIDQDVTTVTMTFTRPEKGYSSVKVEDDDPKGYADLSHAYTLFARSSKLGDPTKSGQFNFGEKRVLSTCRSATIRTTSGAVSFEEDGTRHSRPSLKTSRGSVFEGEMRLTVAEWEDICRKVRSLLPPEHVVVTFNGERIEHREPLRAFQESLQTVVVAKDEEGREVARKGTRKTEVRVLEVLEGEQATLYELGIPVVELPGDKWHVDVRQKTPVNIDRKNVPPAYLRALRVAVLNQMHESIREEDANATWVRDAASDPRCSDAAITKVLHERFGDRFVAFDPSDIEANKKAVADDYVQVTGRMLSTGEWANAKRAQAILPAGQVTPSSPRELEGVPPIPDSKLTDGMRAVAKIVDRVSRQIEAKDGGKLFPQGVAVTFISAPQAANIASYGAFRVTYNVGRLGKKFFDFDVVTPEFIDLTSHELAHQISGDHLSKSYNDGISWVAGQLVRLALTKPELFAP